MKKIPEKFDCEESKNIPLTMNRLEKILLERDEKILELEDEIVKIQKNLNDILDNKFLKKVLKWL